MSEETIYQKVDIIEKLLKYGLGRIRNLKKALRDPDMLRREAKTREPELENKLIQTLDKLIRTENLMDE